MNRSSWVLAIVLVTVALALCYGAFMLALTHPWVMLALCAVWIVIVLFGIGAHREDPRPRGSSGQEVLVETMNGVEMFIIPADMLPPGSDYEYVLERH